MGKAKKAVAVCAILLVTTMLMAASCEGEVIKREHVGNRYKIVYKRENGSERIEWVTKAEFDACQKGEKWPACKDGIHNGMRNLPVNTPRAGRDDNENARTVCFEFTSYPRRRMSYKWYTPRRQEGPREGEWGTYNKCVLVERNQAVNMTVEHITGPSTVACTIWAYRKGKKEILDYMITQAYGDCKVQGRVP